jgi:two-component system cell cycle response regulator
VSVEAVEQPSRPKVLLVGDASARPAGLERALTRAGFQLVERDDADAGFPADAVLITLNRVDGEPLSQLADSNAAEPSTVPPRIVLLSTPDPDGPAAALLQGASDALASPIHLPELCARLHARIRERLEGGDQLAPPSAAPMSNGAEPIHAATDVLDRRVQEEFERARRYSLSFSLILLGVDELAGLSERLGPEAAERRRREVGGVLRRELRLPDFVVPYGTDEFAIVLPETDGTGARQSVTRIRERLAAVPFEGDPREERPRFSAGIVTYPHPAASQTEDLFDLAEAALMRGKAQSGERIGVAM